MSLTQYVPDRRDYHPRLVPVSEPDICFRVLAKGRLDVAISDLSVGLSQIKKLKYNRDTTVRESTITFLNTTLFSKGYPLAFKKSDYPEFKVLSDRFWTALLAMQASGMYQNIVDLWRK